MIHLEEFIGLWEFTPLNYWSEIPVEKLVMGPTGPFSAGLWYSLFLTGHW
jgi:hypothetical protein